MTHRSRLNGATASIAICFALAAQPVFAQEGVGDAETVEAETVDEEQSIGDAGAPASGVVAEDEENTILVTGSRIRRSEATSAAPLQIIDPVIQRRGGANSTAAIIQSSPLASGSSQITSAISINSPSVSGGPGAATVSLRGLGAERTLVLLNSRRAGPAGTRGAVNAFDLNVLPGSIIESVEVLKDGASSIYGSDAIAGVVNIITRRDTDGLELDGFMSNPFKDGGEEYSISATYGHDFGRGHFLVSGEYYRQDMLRRQDRDFLDCDYDYLFRTDAGNERVDLIDPRTGEYWCDGAPWGHVWAYFASNVPQTPSPSTLFQYSYGNDNLGQYLDPAGPATQPFDVVAPPGWFPVAYLTRMSNSLVNSYHPFERKSSVIPDTDRYTLYADGAFELSDGLEIYAEGLFNRRRTYQDSYAQFYNFGYTGLYAPGDPDDPFPGWGSIPGASAFLSPTGLLDNYDREITVDYYRAVAGLRGDVTDRIGFDVHGQYSRSKGEYKLDQILRDAITQQTDRANGAGCAGLVTPVSNRECLQINWVDPRVMAGDFTPEEEAYFTETETGRTIYEQLFVEASISGEVIELPAGWLGVAAGGVIRRDKINDLPGHITYASNPDFDPALPADADNREFIDNAFSNDFSSGHTFGHSVTKELFAEIEVPVFRDQPFADSFTLSAAGRVTNVKAVRGVDDFSASSNGNFTYKLMANWQITPWVRVRGTYGTSYRAPALFEQFLAGQQSSDRQINVDPCVRWEEGRSNGSITQRIADNCAAAGIPPAHTGAGIPVDIFTSGGIGELEPETSRAWTASLILTPRLSFLPNTDIDLTVDYFDIKVIGEIAQLDGYDILYNCYNAETYPDSPFCDLFERGQDGDLNNVRNIFRNYINIDEQLNRGFDFTLRVRHDLGSAGTLSLLGQATLQTKDTITRLEDFDDLNGEVGDPKFTGSIDVTWDYEDWSLFYGLDLIGKSSSREQFLEDNGVICTTSADFIPVYGGDYCNRPWTKAVVYHTASLTKEFLDRFELTVGVANIFDTRPPEVSGVTELGSSPYVSQYDWLGRRLFMNFGARF